MRKKPWFAFKLMLLVESMGCTDRKATYGCCNREVIWQSSQFTGQLSLRELNEFICI